MKKILLSILTIGVVGAVAAFGITRAFFSDTETSTGNILAAGAIDLLIDNESYVTNADGVLVASPNTSWELSDLNGHVFFNFTDVKPGDIGEDTISLHVNDNDAWVCAAAQITEDSDADYSEPELEDDLTVNQNDPQNTDGELAENLNFAFWADDGDNVYEEGENIFVEGSAANLDSAGKIALADSENNVWTGNGDDPITGAETVYVGKAWCFGELNPTPFAQDADTGPLVRGTGFSCDGASDANNAAQTDRVVGDFQFYAVQSRNNASFTCEENFTPDFPTSQTFVIDSVDDLDPGPREVAAVNNSHKWFFYNDENDTINNTLGSFVSGPAAPFLGTGSAQMSVTGTQRRNIATYQFKDVKLADIDAMSFATYSQVAGDGSPGTERAPYLHFNVDFNNSDTWQRRLVYVPGANGVVTGDTWQSWNTTGTALWTWSGFAANGNQWPDGNTNPNRTWNDIVAAFPNAETRSTDSWLGVRVGEPYANGFTGNVDNFSITVNGVVKTFDFDN